MTERVEATIGNFSMFYLVLTVVAKVRLTDKPDGHGIPGVEREMMKAGRSVYGGLPVLG